VFDPVIIAVSRAGHTFALHFLLQDPKSLIDIVVSDEHLQNALLCVEDRS
jgi:hypothetical protein